MADTPRAREEAVHAAETLFVAFLGMLLTVLPAWGAAPATTLEEHAAAVTRAAQSPEGERVVVQRLAQELNISPNTLQIQREQTKLGWGEFFIANRLAQRTGLSFSQIVSEFRSGKGWGEIAREHNLNLGKLVSEVRESREAIAAQAQRAERGRPGVAGEPGGRGEGSGRPSGGPGFGGGGMGPGFGGMGPGGFHGGRGR